MASPWLPPALSTRQTLCHAWARPTQSGLRPRCGAWNSVRGQKWTGGPRRVSAAPCASPVLAAASRARASSGGPCCGGPEHPALLSSVPGKLSRGCPRTAGVPPAMRETPGNQACSHVRGGEALLKPETGGVRVCSPCLTGRALGWLSRSSGPRAVCGAAGMRGPPAPARSCLSRGAGSHGCRCSGSLSRAHACHSCYLGKSPCESRCLEGSEITGVGGLLADWTDRGRGSVRMRGAGPWVPDSSGSRGLHAAL